MQRLNKIKEKLQGKYDSFEYIYAPLPVNEIENFAVLSNNAFDEEFWNNIKTNVINKFENCVHTNITHFDRFFSFNEPLFRNGGNGWVVFFFGFEKKVLFLRYIFYCHHFF